MVLLVEQRKRKKSAGAKTSALFLPIHSGRFWLELHVPLHGEHVGVRGFATGQAATKATAGVAVG